MFMSAYAKLFAFADDVRLGCIVGNLSADVVLRCCDVGVVGKLHQTIEHVTWPYDL